MRSGYFVLGDRGAWAGRPTDCIVIDFSSDKIVDAFVPLMRIEATMRQKSVIAFVIINENDYDGIHSSQFFPFDFGL